MPDSADSVMSSSGATQTETIPFVDLGAQNNGVAKEIMAAVEGCLARSDYILGSEVQKFERAFAEFCGTSHAIGVSSGLDALRLALMALDIGAGDDVIVPANTYIATALAASSVGARPVLVDCDRTTYNIDVGQIEAAITPRTKAILPVHLTGQAADMDAVLQIAGKHGLRVVEDAAQAHGTLYKGRPCGSMGDIGCFSFYPSKNLGACGDGGGMTTNDAKLAESLGHLRNYGQKVKYHHDTKGVNARLDTLQAAILNIKLPRLKSWNDARAKHAERYRELLRGVGDLSFQQQAADTTHIYHLFIIETAHRDALQQHLQAANIQSGVHYPIPVHLQAAYADLGHRAGDFPAAEEAAKRMLSLPMFAELTEHQISRVADAIKGFFAGKR